MHITPDAIAATISTAPAWALVSLTVPDEQLREDGAQELARHVYQTLYAPVRVDKDQLPLPL